MIQINAAKTLIQEEVRIRNLPAVEGCQSWCHSDDILMSLHYLISPTYWFLPPSLSNWILFPRICAGGNTYFKHSPQKKIKYCSTTSDVMILDVRTVSVFRHGIFMGCFFNFSRSTLASTLRCRRDYQSLGWRWRLEYLSIRWLKLEDTPNKNLRKKTKAQK